MTRESSVRRPLGALVLAAALAAATSPVRAAIETDPGALYLTMRAAYDAGAAKRWPYAASLYYQTTVFDAGRAYALFKPDDPQYAEVAGVAVDLAAKLHYDPLINNDASEWYVRDAAAYVAQHGDAGRQDAARALLAKLQAAEGAEGALARQAVDDALQNAIAFNRDPDSLADLVVAQIRAFNLTKDPAYRSAALQRGLQRNVPLARIPDPEATEFWSFVQSALAGGASVSEEDRAAAKGLDAIRRKTPALQVIGRLRAVPHDLHLTRTAPADEYFGQTKLSPIGVGNEIVRINKYLDAGWGDRMAGDALWVENSLLDWQRQYPHDTTLPRHLLDCYALLRRVGAASTTSEAAKVRLLLLVQYAGSPQARQLAAT